jgi:hypothetical protein
MKQCDPNGIRTRVTAVKGRCPGPLDDRVTSASNIRIATLQRKVNCPAKSILVLNLAKLLLSPLVGIQFVNQRRCTRSCTLMLPQNLARGLDDALACFAIEQKLADRLFK